MEESTTKFTPIIVTEKKIISLKKKPDSNTSTASQRTMPLAKLAPETKKIDLPSTAPTISKPVKPVLRIQTTQRLSDLEDYDEDELLADSPTPPANPIASANITGGMFTNRRVVLTTSTEPAKPKILLTKNTATKGIFDRLDAKLGITDAAKRKIQKIVIKTND